jgi:hypothetical protein
MLCNSDLTWVELSISLATGSTCWRVLIVSSHMHMPLLALVLVLVVPPRQWSA